VNDILQNPGSRDHFVRLYDQTADLAGAVAEYMRSGLERGEAAIIIATAEHRRAFLARLPAGDERLVVLDAEGTLERFMANGMPQWGEFHRVIGGLIAELRLRYPAVRAYGEMVDVLWQRGEREAAIRLEEYWNELGQLQTFSLFCAYRMDPRDPAQYGGALQSVCKVHSHLLPARDIERFDAAVRAASTRVLREPLAGLLLALAASHQPATLMPLGQATLFWLHRNMPRTAEKVLSELSAEPSTAG
jgi:hypothetical protein